MWKLVRMHRKYSLLRMQLNVSYLSSEHNWEKHGLKFASRLPVKRDRKSNAVRLVYDCMEAILCKKYHAMVLYWRLRYSLHQHSFVNTPFFFSAKEHKELRIHKGVFESFSSLHTKRWKCINANNYGDKYISQMCVRYFRLLLQFYSRHYTVPDRVAMPSEFSNNVVYERQH